MWHEEKYLTLRDAGCLFAKEKATPKSSFMMVLHTRLEGFTVCFFCGRCLLPFVAYHINLIGAAFIALRPVRTVVYFTKYIFCHGYPPPSWFIMNKFRSVYSQRHIKRWLTALSMRSHNALIHSSLPKQSASVILFVSP